ncbi:Aste57867_13497 [Aphanomyces stellatus]|uniref:Aste57867_13497 protein n=1 Tax=Aphanomyces stellatus TaxID=120398 RepID=A0A485KY82_9STRA|nr:hypothetical protein As57867_013447 [Aphanomyces stellatus]VFT90335.1 Aste57867_13497 [Aphanomyces stellatus]
MLDSGVLDDFMRVPWQSFSTMKRFVSEGNRLENASWRLWHMQRLHRLGPRHAANVHGSDDPFDEHESRTCVYCELAPASLACNGCCHDAYCIGCFKLVHKRGHLATHTAVQLTKAPPRPPNVPASSPAIMSARHKPVGAPTNNAKVWEHKLDALFQKLMVTSLHHDGDISVHNLSLSTDAPTTAGPSNTASAALAPTPSSSSADLVASITTTVVSSSSSRSAKRTPVCNTCKGPHMTILCPLLQPADPIPSPSSPPPPLPMDSPSLSLVCTYCQGPHSLPRCPMLDAPKATKKAKRIACGNCRGDHMTIDCPQMPQASTPKHEKAAFVRKVFTNYHNDNASNSTHAYLGDEVSVHGVHDLHRHVTPPAQLAHYESIQEESSDDTHDAQLPVLPPLAPTANERRPDVWILSALQELPVDLPLRRLHRPGSTCTSHCWCDHLTRQGYVYVRPFSASTPASPKWVRRYMVLYRNTLSEYLDEDDDRPVGYANVSEAAMSMDDGVLTLSVSTTARRTDGWNVSAWTFESAGDGNQWLAALESASQLQWTDLFGDDDGLELGQGRFSVVKRAQRKIPSACAKESALKIVDKAAFWELVAQGIERNDTLFREVLTQSVLTMRCPRSHECFVVQLLSLFETHDHLVIEMELMHGGDVFDRIADQGPFPERQAAVFVSHLVQGIDFCMKNGVVHRDVKLSNLALDEGTEFGSIARSSVLKLADFGMAAFLLPNGMLRGRCGTPGYVAPEILLAGVNEAYPPHVDMFSAGVVLYTLLCGYEPFFGRNDKELIALNKSVVYSFHPQEWSHISDAAKDLIQLMMQPDVNRRITPEDALRHPFLQDIPVASFTGSIACARLF